MPPSIEDLHARLKEAMGDEAEAFEMEDEPVLDVKRQDNGLGFDISAEAMQSILEERVLLFTGMLEVLGVPPLSPERPYLRRSLVPAPALEFVEECSVDYDEAPGKTKAQRV